MIADGMRPCSLKCCPWHAFYAQVKVLNLEEGGAFTVSSADNILAGL